MMMKVFLSYYSGEQSEAEDLRDDLVRAFHGRDIEFFTASSWDSIPPGDQWESRLISAVEKTDALVVLMSIDALGRPWLNFEIGVAWAKKARILLLCHKGLSPSALPRPYSSLQAVDLNDLRAQDRVQKVVQALATALNVAAPTPIPTDAETVPTDSQSFASMYRTWSLRPGAHVDECADGNFLVGVVIPCRADRAKTAGLKPGEALYVRLFPGATPEGYYVPTIVAGENARFFERVSRDTIRIDAKLRLAAVFEEEDRTVPLVVMESYRESTKATKTQQASQTQSGRRSG